MAKKSTTFGLRPDKLVHILGIFSDSGQGEDEITIDQQKAELLQDRLSETLLTGSIKESPLRKELAQLCYMSGVATGEQIRDLLDNPKVDLNLLKKVKAYGKRLSKSASSEVEHDIANIIYYAAIASALVFHEAKISQFSYKDLEKSFLALSEEDWVPSDFHDFFTKTSLYCKKR